METRLLNYRIIIEPDTYPDTGKRCYSAYCPTLGLADYGDSVEEALSRIKKLIKFHIESLIADNQPVPAPDQEEEFISVAKVKVEIPKFGVVMG